MNHSTLILTGLLALCLAVPAAFSADLSAVGSAKAEPATAPAGVTLPKPDLSKPLCVIIQCDKTTPPTLTAEQKKTVGGLFNGPFFNGRVAWMAAEPVMGLRPLTWWHGWASQFRLQSER